jgi:hypothetical protein
MDAFTFAAITAMQPTRRIKARTHIRTWRCWFGICGYRHT